MNADTIRRLAAVDMPAEALREVLTIFAEIEAKNEERRAREAARKRADRHAKKYASADNPRIVQGMSSGSLADVQHAPARAREEVLTSLDSSKSFQRKDPLKGVQKKGFLKSQISEDVQPTERDQAVAEREGMSPATFRLEWQKWRSHHVSEAKPVANIHQSWVKWASNWVSYGRRQDGPQARAGPQRSNGDGMTVVLQKLREQVNGQSSNGIKDVSPTTVPEPRTSDPDPQLFEPPRKPSGGGEVLDFRPASPDLRRSAATYGEAAGTLEWPQPSWEYS